MTYSIQMYFLLFITYSILGWIIEVICKLVQYKRFINRGFLIGPYCPIYGVGATLITILLNKYTDDPIALFLFALVICSILEYFTSFILEKIFHARWWDYSNKKFNLNGRICIETMLPFGALGLFLMYVSNPILLNAFNNLNLKTINVLTYVLVVIFITDIIISFIVLASIRKDNKVLDKDNTEEMSRKVRTIITEHGWLHRRILNAFPDVRHIGIVLKKSSRIVRNKIQTQIDKTTEKQQEIFNKAEKELLKIQKEYNKKFDNIRKKTNKRMSRVIKRNLNNKH